MLARLDEVGCKGLRFVDKGIQREDLQCAWENVFALSFAELCSNGKMHALIPLVRYA